MPSLRDEITKTFLRLTKRYTPVPGPSKRGSGERATLRTNSEIGSYRIVRELGAGGMGHVYLALDTRLGRHVALKFLPPELTAEPAFLRRFQQEARTASALNHPNILTIHEFPEIDGQHIIVSEFVDGVTLRSALDRNVIDLSKGLDIVAQVASALVAAHAAGVVHRDLKPTNIMIRPDGYVKVIDFGLAKLTERSARSKSQGTSWTQPGSVLGTVGYMSPEQARGDDLDERSDIWSLGVVLYEIVARHPPFEGDTDHHVIVSILDDPPRPIPDAQKLPSGLIPIITRALTKNRNQRYESVGILLADLQSVQRESGNSTPSHIVAVARPRRRYFLPVVILVLLAIAFGVWWWPLGGKWKVLGPTWFETGQTERVTFDGNVLLATISPDGSRLAYTVGASGNEVLKIRNFQTREESSLPAANTYSGLTFSPDGKWLFYVLRDTKAEMGTLFNVPVDALGSSPPGMILRDVDGPVTFAPDGRSFAFVRRSNTGGIHRESILIAQDSNTRDAQAMVTLQQTEIAPQLAWSANGLIASVSYPERLHQPTRAVLSLYTPQGARKGDFSLADVRVLRNPVFLDGGSLLVMAARSYGTEMGRLIQFSAPTAAFHQIPSDVAGYRSVSATADSRTLAAVRLEERSSVWVADASALGQPERITPETESYQSLAWRDDDRIIVPAERNGSINLKQIDARGGVMKDIANPENCVEAQPAARLGQPFIVYSSNCAHGGNEFDIWLLDGLTGRRRALTSGSNVEKDPDLSPDGKWIVFTSNAAGTPALWRVSTSGGEAGPLTSRQSQFPFISPDGKKIVCQVREHLGSWSVAILSAEDGSLVRSFPDLPIASLVRWSPDGAALDYLETRNGKTGLWRQPLNGSAPRALTHTGEGQIIFFAWNEKGTRLAYIRNRAESDVVAFRRSPRH